MFKEVVLLSPIILLIWIYGGYPVVLKLINKLKKDTILKEPIKPKVSLIICTYNESSVIDRRIKNILKQDYPREKLEIIVVDSSTDATAEIIKEKWRKDVLLIEEEERRGKASAINLGLKKTSGDIVILSDAPALFYKDTIKNIVKNFADLRVGGVTGKYEPIGGEKLYWKFKNKLRYLEGQIDSTTWLSGELCAFRKSIVNKIDEDSLADDVNVALKVRENGFKAIYDNSARFSERVPETYKDFVIQKTRRAIGGIQEIVRFKSMILNPRFGLFGMLIMPTMFIFTVLNPIIFLMGLASFTYILIQVNPYLTLSFFLLFAFLTLFKRGFLGNDIRTFLMTEIVQLKALIKYVFGDFGATWEQAQTTRKSTYNDKMKIYFLTTWFERLGGAEKALKILALNLKEENYVRILVFNPACIDVSYSFNEIQIKEFRTYKIFKSFSVTSPMTLLKVLLELRKADVFFVHQYYTFPAFIAALASSVWGTPLILKPIAPIPTEYPPYTSFQRFLGRILNRSLYYFILQKATSITPTSNFEKNYLQKLGINPNKIRVIPSGLDAAFLKFKKSSGMRLDFRRNHSLPENAKILLYVGRIHEMKGLSILVKALPFILNIFSQTYVFFVGEGSEKYKNELKNLAFKLKVNDKVIFMGYLEGKSLLDCYAASDVFVNPSFMECAPLSIREAEAVGNPVVATDVGGTSEYLRNNIDGLLVPPGDKYLLSKAIITLLSSKKRCKTENLLIKQFTWELYVSKMKSIFEQIKRSSKVDRQMLEFI